MFFRIAINCMISNVINPSQLITLYIQMNEGAIYWLLLLVCFGFLHVIHFRFRQQTQQSFAK